MMEQKKKIPSRILISVFLILYLSRETLLFGTNSSGTMKLVGYAGMLLLALYWMSKGKITKKRFGVASTFIFLGFLTLITTGIDIKFLYVFLLVIFAAFFCTNVKFDDFVEAYQKIMLFLAVYSIIVFALYEIAYSLILQFPIFENEAGIRFVNLVFDMPMVKIPYHSHRSFSIFREPGVYMVFLNIALMFELFFNKNNQSKRTIAHVVIYVIAVALTRSTAGYIVMALVLTLYLFFGSNSQKHKRLKFVIFIVFLAGALWLFFDEDMFNVVFGKLMGDNYSKASRLESVYANVRMIAENIERSLTGLGFSFVEENFAYYSTELNMSDNTNTIFRLFAIYGVVYISLLMWLIFKFFARVKNTMLAIFLFVAFCLCLFNESLIVNIILYIIAFYALDNDCTIKKSQK
jgi:hypothetical protein